MVEINSQFFSFLAAFFSICVLVSSYFSNHLKGKESDNQIQELRNENIRLAKDNGQLINVKTDELIELSADLKTSSYQMYRSYLKLNTPELSLISTTITRDEKSLEFVVRNTGKLKFGQIKFLYSNKIRYLHNGILVKEVPSPRLGSVYLRAKIGEEFAPGDEETIYLEFLNEFQGEKTEYDTIEIATTITVSNPDYSTSNMTNVLTYQPRLRRWQVNNDNFGPTFSFGILP